MIKIIVSEQMLYHHRKTGVVCAYPVSTARNGVGNIENSLQTPLGKHQICAKIGGGLPVYTYFESREPKGIFTQKTAHHKADWILSRILWLTGVQTGVNKRGKVDTKKRYIYIHGTNEEDKIGLPVSHGCIRMLNADVVHLFEHACYGESVFIKV
ncbi:L,D-transpeptidase [Ghiorsea bivora]|uniref:L,D-transpeptidase n=1 Tax=Ghiorsea bivora TaxID=1485545 RepID=UPI00056FD349|nr:L,D-transpeptidase [Ghiorsea bivora]